MVLCLDQKKLTRFSFLGLRLCEKVVAPLLCKKSKKRWLNSFKLSEIPTSKRLANGSYFGITGKKVEVEVIFEIVVHRFVEPCSVE